MERETITLNGEVHAYRVRYSRRRTLALHVSRRRGIEVRAPRGCPRGVLLEFVESRRPWLIRTLDRLAALPLPAGWVDGGEHRYLGEPMRLQVRTGRPSGAAYRDGVLTVTVAEAIPERVGAVVREWYRRRSGPVFEAAVDAWFPALGLPASRRPRVKIRAMRRQWGSCARHGGINLNLWLMRAPPACVDYVVAHELCHLLEFNHSPAFHAYMDLIMPDWRQRRAALREHERRWPLPE